MSGISARIEPTGVDANAALMLVQYLESPAAVGLLTRAADRLTLDYLGLRLTFTAPHGQRTASGSPFRGMT